MAVFVMKDLFTNLFGKLEGIVLFQLLEATTTSAFVRLILDIYGNNQKTLFELTWRFNPLPF